MDILERERQQQRNTERLREMAMKNRGVVREDAERKRVLDPRERRMDRGMIPDRGMVDRERMRERPVMKERIGVGERDSKQGIAAERMAERDMRPVEIDGDRETVRQVSLERVRGLPRERDDERAAERMRDVERDVIVSDRLVDIEREELLKELVSSYKSALAELTFNSKPIITNLTIIAGENAHAAKGITSTVCNHILEVPKEQKLPSLYLLDSIVKNIGGDYIKFFAARLPEVFVKAYRHVDPATTPAMQHLFRTWRGVFPLAPLRVIEDELDISASSTHGGPSVASPPVRPAESQMQRTGHGIHVNPKYLEAQRQRLQQTGQADSVAPESNGSAAIRGTEGPTLRESSKGWSDTLGKRPPVPMAPRGKRDEYSEPDYGRDVPFDYDFDDYGLSNSRKSVPGRGMDRDDSWGEPGYLREVDGDSFSHEEGRSPRARYGARNGYEWRQPISRGTEMDGYGYNRGPGPGRGAPFRPVQTPVEVSEGSGRGPTDSWLKTDEEEYVWEDMSPRLEQPQVRDEDRSREGLSKDDWFASETERGISSTETGRLKRTSLDAGFADIVNWRRHGPGGHIEQGQSAGERLPLKDFDDRSRMQPALGVRDREPGVGDQVSGVRGSLSGSGGRTHSGWPPQVRSPRNLSPSSQSRGRPGPPPPAVQNRNVSPTARNPPNIFPRDGTPPTPSNGAVHPVSSSSHFESRQSTRPNAGSFTGSPTYSNISPMTPGSGIPFQHRQQSHRHPSPPSQLSGHQIHQIPPLPSSQQQNQQTQLQQLQHDQSGHLQPGRHQLQGPTQLQNPGPHSGAPSSHTVQHITQSQVAPSLQQSAQQPQSLQHLSPQQILPIQQTSQPPGPQQQQGTSIQQPSASGLHQQQLQQPQNQLQQQPVSQQSAPLLPLISSQLAQSLQQLAQQQQQQQQSQALPLLQQPQISQSLGLLTQVLAPVPNGPSSGSVQAPQSQSSSNELLTAFLQSGLIPSSQNAPVLPQPQLAPPRASPAPVQSNPPQTGFQGQPPLPSGPPPAQFSGTVGLAAGGPAVQTSNTASQMSTFGLPSRYNPPPLPPGPPPTSTIVGSAGSQSTPSGGLSSSISSILSSLVAHGVIAPVPAPSVPLSSTPTLPVVTPQANAALGLVSMGVLPTPSANVPITVVTPPVSAALVTSVMVPAVPRQEVAASPPTSRNEAIGTEFKQEILRERHEYVIEALYSDFPRQCKTCGLRFKAQDEHSKHMDWHVSRNRRQKSQKKISRKWFVSSKEWLSGTGAAASEFTPSFFAEESGAKDENVEIVAVPEDENQSACHLCGEPFEDFYSDETDEWMYKGAVYLNVPPGGSTEGLDSAALGPIVHLKCKTESAEIATADFAEDDEEVQPELQAADSVRMEIDGSGGDSIMPLLTDNFDTSEIKEENDDLGSRRKRTRY